MSETLRGVDLDRLERSCRPRGDSIRVGSSALGIDRVEVYLTTLAFEPHRHDTYAIGITTAGVQTFRYRGVRRVCLPGQLHILHPDETHDGAAGTDEGFGYRILYLAPELVHDALDGRALPFVADPVQSSTPATRLIASVLADIDEPISDLLRVEIAATIADILHGLSDGDEQRQSPIDVRAVQVAREYLTTHACEQTPASTLEQVADIDRFTLARHFRRAFGTTPDRYRRLRRVDLARNAIEAGLSLARAAADAGFADQSHMTRQFKQAYGLTPARWANIVSGAASPQDRLGRAPRAQSMPGRSA
jgi:AraC-like DNA-binding protein